MFGLCGIGQRWHFHVTLLGFLWFAAHVIDSSMKTTFSLTSSSFLGDFSVAGFEPKSSICLQVRCQVVVFRVGSWVSLCGAVCSAVSIYKIIPVRVAWSCRERLSQEGIS